MVAMRIILFLAFANRVCGRRGVLKAALNPSYQQPRASARVGHLVSHLPEHLYQTEGACALPSRRKNETMALTSARIG
jgi:hypothetical protein